MAAVSLRPGDRWDQRIIAELKSSNVIFYLASEVSVASPYVQQELGMATAIGKQVLPVVWNMSPEWLPGFLKNIQALDLRQISPENYSAKLAEVANIIRTKENTDQRNALLIATALVVVLLILASKK